MRRPETGMNNLFSMPLHLKYNEPENTQTDNGLSQAGALLGSKGVAGPATIDNGSFEQSDLSQKALNFLKEKSGLKFSIVPLPKDTPLDVAGGFNPANPSNNKDNRVLEFNKNSETSLGTLFHEAGHSLDNIIDKSKEVPADFNTLGKAFFKNRPGALEYAYQKGIPEFGNFQKPPAGRKRFEEEVEGQRAAGQFLNEFTFDKPEQSPTDYTNSPWYKGYPMSYVDDTFSNFYKPLVAPAKSHDPYNPSSWFNNEFGSDTRLQLNTILSDALNPAMQKEKASILKRSKDFIDSQLNAYQPAEDSSLYGPGQIRPASWSTDPYGKSWSEPWQQQ